MYETAEERAALFDFTGKYTEVELLNRRATGFGWAVLVQDNFEAQRLKVIKIPNSESATRELLVEAEILTKISQYLRHPNLIQLLSVDKYVIQWNDKREDRWFLVLQFGGTNLRSRLGRLGMRDQEFVYRDGSILPMEETLNMAMQMADGLRALHEFEESPGQHIIHRDIKPENILVDPQGNVRLADFGISKVVERLTQSVTAAGTPPYLAPEYSRGRLHACSDIYSLGIVLYEMATGCFPFRTHQDRFYEMPTPPHEIAPQLPPAFSDVILRCLWWDCHAERGREEAQRYQTAAELLEDLRRCARRLHPVPPRFQKPAQATEDPHCYFDTQTTRPVRIYLYPSDRASLCCSRLAGLLQTVPKVLCPEHVFESEEGVGVVVPPPPDAAPGLVARPPQDGSEVQRLVEATAGLARQLEALHRVGIYHGFLAPRQLFSTDDGVWIDQVWLGSLVGLVHPDAVFAKSDDLPGYVAPETLAWRSPPSLSSDVYGVGAVLYGSLMGTPPLAPDAVREAISTGTTLTCRSLFGSRSRAPLMTCKLEALLGKLLQPDPLNRPRSMQEVIVELESCQWQEDMVRTLVEDARQYQKQNRLAEAYEALDRALQLDPGSPLVHHARAEIFFLEGSPRWALEENAKALLVAPSGSVWFLHGQCHAAMENYEQAEHDYRRGLELEDCSRGRYLLAKCLEKTGRNEHAIQEYRQAVRMAEQVERNTVLMAEIQESLSALQKRIQI